MLHGTSVICCLLYWCCKRTQKLETRSLACVTNADPENPNMLHTRVGATGTDKCSVLGWETVGIQDPVGTQHTVLSNDMQYAFTSALLAPMRLSNRQHTARTPIDAKTSTEIQYV